MVMKVVSISTIIRNVSMHLFSLTSSPCFAEHPCAVILQQNLERPSPHAHQKLQRIRGKGLSGCTSTAAQMCSSAWREQPALGWWPQRITTDASAFISFITFYMHSNFLISSTSKFHFHLCSLTGPLGTTNVTSKEDTGDTNRSVLKPSVTSLQRTLPSFSGRAHQAGRQSLLSSPRKQFRKSPTAEPYPTSPSWAISHTGECWTTVTLLFFIRHSKAKRLQLKSFKKDIFSQLWGRARARNWFPIPRTPSVTSP